MELNTIQTNGTWGQRAADLNDNFTKIGNTVEQLRYSTTRFKGHFLTEESLKSVCFSPSVGEYAYVGGYPGTVYDCTSFGTWRNTGETAPGNSLNLNDYATNEALSAIETVAKGSVYNASMLDTSGNNLFTLDTALTSVPDRYRKIVTLITFLGYGVGNTLQSYTYQFNSNDISRFTDSSLWTRIASNAYIDEKVQEIKQELAQTIRYDDTPLTSRVSSLETKILNIENIEGLGLVLVADSERKCGFYRIGGMELDLYECTFKINNLPSTANTEQEYMISDDPLGNRTYIAVRDFVVTDGDTFFPDNYKVVKIHVDTEYRTRVLIKCTQPLDANYYAYLALKYVKFDGIKFELKIKGLSSADASSANLVFPPLKFDKKFAYSYTFDDCTIMAYSRGFNTINKKWIDEHRFFHVGQEKSTGSYPSKTLGYTDGLGMERRFTLGVAIWPDAHNNNIDDFMKPTTHTPDKFYPYLVWDDLKPMLEFGNEIYFHDVDTHDDNSVAGILKGLKESQRITLENTEGHGMKIIARPNGNNDYLTAGREYEDVLFMVAENKPDIGSILNVTFDNDIDLRKAVQYRRFVESIASLSGLMTDIDSKALSDTYAWLHDFSHGPENFQYVLDLYATLNDKYGKDGIDTIWFATLDEIYEYWFMRRYSKIRKVIESDGVRFTLFIPNLKYARHRDFTLQLSNMVYSASLSATLLTPEKVYGFSFGNINSRFSINVNLEKQQLYLAEKYVETYISSLLTEDKEDAFYFINQLRRELKEEFMAKIEAAEVAPVLNAIKINDGDVTTYAAKVNVSFDYVGKFTHYKLSESADMASLSWVEGSSKKIAFTLSAGYTKKTLYVTLKNAFGESVVRSASITYAEITADTVILNSVKINNGATSTSDAVVTVALSLSGTPTHYMISESPTFIGTTWQLYGSNNISFTLSAGNGSKTVYVKVKNAISESNVKSANITLGSGGVNPPVEQNSKTIACFNSSLSMEGYNGINVNTTQISLKDITGKIYITFLRNDIAGDDLSTRPGGSANFNPDEIVGAPYPYDVYKQPICAHGKTGEEKYLYFNAKEGIYNVKIYANTKYGNDGDSDYRTYIVNGEEKVPNFEVKGNTSNLLVWENVSPIDGKIRITLHIGKDWIVVPVNVIEFELVS